jgi:hypothetical protein
MNARVARITVCTPGPHHRVHTGPVSPCARRARIAVRKPIEASESEGPLLEPAKSEALQKG